MIARRDFKGMGVACVIIDHRYVMRGDMRLELSPAQYFIDACS
jgi:hypothetical protein